MPGLKSFSPKCGLPNVGNYNGKVEESYCSSWPCLDWKTARKIKTSINPDKLESMAVDSGYPYPTIIQDVLKDIRVGACIGVSKDFQVPSKSSNAPSSFEFERECQTPFAK